MNIYTFAEDPSAMGDEHPQFGYTFWSKVEESDLPIMFNSKKGNLFQGDKIVAEEQTEKTSKNGTDYLRLSKTKISDALGEAKEPVKIAPKQPKSTWVPKDEKQITRNMAWKNLLGFYDVSSMEPDTDRWNHFWGMVDLHTEYLLRGSAGGESEAKSPQAPIKEPPKAAAPWEETRKKFSKKLDADEANDFLNSLEAENEG